MMFARHLLTLCALLIFDPPLRSQAAVDPRQGVRFDQQLGVQLPGNVVLRDEAGRDETLSQLIDATPTVLVFGYSGCSQLCPVVLQSATLALGRTRLLAGRDWRGLFVSIDPADGTRQLAAMKSAQIPTTQQAAWHFVGGDNGVPATLATDVGFVAKHDQSTAQFAYGTGLVLLSPQGRVVRYFFGTEFDPELLRMTLLVAEDGEPQASAQPLLLTCFHVVQSVGRRTGLLLHGLQLFCAVFMLAVARALWRYRHIPPGSSP